VASIVERAAVDMTTGVPLVIRLAES
jgi:hypothetical protein